MKRTLCFVLALTAVLFTAVHPGAVHAARSAPGESLESAAPTLPDVNTAALEELVVVKGIGPALAQRIIDYRKAKGPFSSVEDLMNVKGIGARKLARIRDLLQLSPPPLPATETSKVSLP